MKKTSSPKEMKQIGELFLKYQNHFKAPQASVVKEFTSSVESVTGYKIKNEQVSYNVATKTISLQIPSVLKSEIKFHHQAILDDLGVKLGKKTTPQTIL